jgi:hypothetical protein
MHYRYAVYGVVLESSIPFPALERIPNRLDGAESISFSVSRSCWKIPAAGWFAYQGFDYWIKFNKRFVFVRSPLTGVFRIDLSGKQILWEFRSNVHLDLIRAVVSRRILALCLSHHDSTLLLHGCITMTGDRVVGLLGPRGRGKSTLGSEFLKSRFPIWSDDIAVVQMKKKQFWIQPGPSEMRLWPESLKRMTNRYQMSAKAIYPRVRKKRIILTPGSMGPITKKPVILKALYVLSRIAKGSIRLETLRGQENLVQIMRNVYNPVLTESRILRHQFDMITSLALQIPVKRLVYPSGFKYLPSVRRAILSDLN